MYTPLDIKNRYTNLYNNLLKELKRYYTKNKVQEPSRPNGELYLEELAFIQRLDLNFSGILSFKIGNKAFPEYLTGLKKLRIKSPCRVSLDFLSLIPNKEQITDLTIDGSDFVSLDLTAFTNLKYLEIINNKDLRTIKGLMDLKNIVDLEFYNNPLVNEKEACEFIVSVMHNDNEINTDILYYKRIVAMIRKKYSNHRDSFRNANWIEAIQAGLKDHQIIKHSTLETGKFYARLSDIIDEITPSVSTDLEDIFLIYSWIVQNVAYDKECLKSKLKMASKETTLNFGGKIQKIRMAYGSIGGTNGAFNAIYGKTVVCQGFTKIFQMLLKAYDYNIDTFDELAYCETDHNVKIVPLKDVKGEARKRINHSIIRIILDGESYFCDTTNERTIDGEVSQKRFMRTYEELTSSWYPSECQYPGLSTPLTEAERETLSNLKMSHNIPYNYEIKAGKMMERFDLHLNSDSEDIQIEKSVKLSQVEDLLLLGIINNEVLRLINSKIEAEYLEIKQRKNMKR